jgi:O-antigen ligase
MIDFVKDFFSNPVYLGLILCIFLSYFFLVIVYLKRKKFPSRLENAFAGTFLFLLNGPVIFPIGTFVPTMLISTEVILPAKAAWIGIFGFGFILSLMRFKYFYKNLLLTFNEPFLWVLLATTFFSVVWSDNPDATLQSSSIFLLVSFFAVYIGSQYTWQKLLSFLRWSSGLVALLSLPASVILPSYGVDYVKGGWKGILGHPNPLAQLMALNILFWSLHLVNKPKNPRLSIVIIITSLIVLVFTSSAGSLCIFIILGSLTFLLRFLKSLKFRWALVSILLFITVSIGMTSWITSNLENILKALGRDLSFTGRTPLWEGVVEKIGQKLFLGYGYGAFWESEDNLAYIQKAAGWVAHQPHNGFLALLLDLGLLGLLLFLLSYLTNLVRAVLYLTHSKSVESLLPIILLVFMILGNLSETNLLLPYPSWFLYVMSAVRLSIDTQGKQNRNNPTYQAATFNHLGKHKTSFY